MNKSIGIVVIETNEASVEMTALITKTRWAFKRNFISFILLIYHPIVLNHMREMVGIVYQLQILPCKTRYYFRSDYNLFEILLHFV